jgi:hypothetical protein
MDEWQLTLDFIGSDWRPTWRLFWSLMVYPPRPRRYAFRMDAKGFFKSNCRDKIESSAYLSELMSEQSSPLQYYLNRDLVEAQNPRQL